MGANDWLCPEVVSQLTHVCISRFFVLFQTPHLIGNFGTDGMIDALANRGDIVSQRLSAL